MDYDVKEKLREIKDHLQQNKIITEFKTKDIAFFLHEWKKNNKVQEFLSSLHRSATSNISSDFKKNALKIIQSYFKYEHEFMEKEKKLQLEIEKYGKRGKEIWRSNVQDGLSADQILFLVMGIFIIVLISVVSYIFLRYIPITYTFTNPSFYLIPLGGILENQYH